MNKQITKRKKTKRKITKRIVLVFYLSLMVVFNACSKNDDMYISDEYTTFIIPGLFVIGVCFDSDVTTNIFVDEGFSPTDSTTWLLKPEYGAKFETNETGGVIYFTANEEQCNNMLEITKMSFENFARNLEEGELEHVECSDDFSSIKIYLSREKLNKAYLGDYVRLETICYAARMFYTNNKNATVKAVYINNETGNVVESHITPFERLSFQSEDWDKSEAENVTECVDYIDNISFSGTFDSMDDNYIYIIPDDPIIFDEYISDCDKVSADKVMISDKDIFIGYKCEQGTRFNVRIEPPEISKYDSGYLKINRTNFFAPEDAEIIE